MNQFYRLLNERGDELHIEPVVEYERRYVDWLGQKYVDGFYWYAGYDAVRFIEDEGYRETCRRLIVDDEYRKLNAEQKTKEMLELAAKPQKQFLKHVKGVINSAISGHDYANADHFGLTVLTSTKTRVERKHRKLLEKLIEECPEKRKYGLTIIEKTLDSLQDNKFVTVELKNEEYFTELAKKVIPLINAWVPKNITVVTRSFGFGLGLEFMYEGKFELGEMTIWKDKINAQRCCSSDSKTLKKTANEVDEKEVFELLDHAIGFEEIDKIAKDGSKSVPVRNEVVWSDLYSRVSEFRDAYVPNSFRNPFEVILREELGLRIGCNATSMAREIWDFLVLVEDYFDNYGIYNYQKWETMATEAMGSFSKLKLMITLCQSADLFDLTPKMKLDYESRNLRQVTSMLANAFRKFEFCRDPNELASLEERSMILKLLEKCHRGQKKYVISVFEDETLSRKELKWFYSRMLWDLGVDDIKSGRLPNELWSNTKVWAEICTEMIFPEVKALDKAA